MKIMCFVLIWYVYTFYYKIRNANFFLNWYICIHKPWALMPSISNDRKRKTCKYKPSRYWVSTKVCQVAFFIPMLTVISNSLNPFLSTSFAFAGYINVLYNRLYFREDNAALSTLCNFELFAIQDIYVIPFVYIFKWIMQSYYSIIIIGKKNLLW